MQIQHSSVISKWMAKEGIYLRQVKLTSSQKNE